jgi:SAM-dependent MidA family methyltransferase
MPASDLNAWLRNRIAFDGPIPFRDFMAAALYDPAHGYYGSGRAAIGRGGDYFTNVSVGPLFGRLLARQFAEMWERLGQPADFTIVEQGAHRGDFARDVLEALPPECRAAMTYRIVEPIECLRHAQRGALGDRAIWHATLDDLPPFTGVHFSNELLDAMPVPLVTWNGAEWLERCVDVREERFVFVDRPIVSEALRAHLATIPPVPAGYVTEVNLEALAWIDTLAARLHRGWVLAIDYGFERAEFYAPERRAGTLRAYSQHRQEADLLARPGELDLTAHVEFTSLIERGAPAGLSLAGFTDQHHFMVGLGRLHFRDDAVPEMSELRAYQTLMHPTMMGTSFHALCLAKGVALSPPLAGFRYARRA